MTTVPPLKITRLPDNKALKLMVATPLYGGADADYLRSVVSLTRAADRAGIACTFGWLSNNAVIDRARNVLAAAFLQSDATHLVFIDGDIGFMPDELLGLVTRMQGDDRLAVVGAPYPKRRINWNMVASAAAKGLAAGNPGALERYSGLFVLDPLDGQGSFRMNEPLEVKRAGTGLMVIRRDVIETLCARHPELRYVPDALDREGGMTGEHLTALFQPLIDPVTGHLLSDDFAFSYRVRDAGFRIWLALWMRTTHTGPARFNGTMIDLAAMSAAPTA